MAAFPIPFAALSWLYGVVVRLRGRWYDRGWLRAVRVSLPVLSVGNITVGGNGKTPLCIALVEELRARGLKPVVLSRGYGGRTRGPYVVRPDDDAQKVGDEPLLMAQRLGVPVVVARRRVRGARLIEREKLGDVIVLDDGFQHRRLARDIDIVAIDVGSEAAIHEFCHGALLPAGRWREDRDRAIARADLFVLVSRSGRTPPDDQIAQVTALLQGKPYFHARPHATEVIACDGEELLWTREVAAFCGIASPEAFFSTLEGLGFNLVARESFPDHHSFRAEEIAALRTRFPNRALICTEKDAVKCKAFGVQGLFHLRVNLIFESAEQFIAQVTKVIPALHTPSVSLEAGAAQRSST